MRLWPLCPCGYCGPCWANPIGLGAVGCGNWDISGVSGRKGRSFANGHVVTVAQEAEVELLRDSDAHESEIRLAQELANQIAVGAGLNV